MTTVRSREPAAGARVLSAGELGEHVGHLVAALAAADVDDHVGIAPFRDLLKQHGLAGAEPARHRAGAAPGHREQQVEHPLAGLQRAAAIQPLGVRPRPPHRPGAGQRDRLAAHGRDRVAGSGRPPAASPLTTPPAPGGTSTRYGTPPGSATVPRQLPAVTTAPSLASGLNSTRVHPAVCRTAVCAPAAGRPGSSQVGAAAATAAAARRRPRRAARGPSLAESGSPRPAAASPGASPPVYS